MPARPTRADERLELGEIPIVGAEGGPKAEGDLLDVGQDGVGDEGRAALGQ